MPNVDQLMDSSNPDLPVNENYWPDEYDGFVDCQSIAICCAYNRIGTLLAVGCNDGRIVIFDYLTRREAKNITAHANYPVSSVSWSRNSRKLVSGSHDNSIAVWHVESGECIVRWTFIAPIVKVQFNPRNYNMVLACVTKHPSIILFVNYDQYDTSGGTKVCTIPQFPISDAGKRQIIDEKIGSIQHHIFLPADKDESDGNMVSSFDRRGQYIYIGNSKGRISVLKCPSYNPTKGDQVPNDSSLELVSSFKIQASGNAPAAIREIEFGAKNKDLFLVNSTDRTIRLYRCDDVFRAGKDGTCEEVKKFQDMVNKTMWKRCCLSGDAEASHVCGGSARQHALYIWETENGAIKKMLSGRKGEMLLDLQWHPSKPALASTSSGLVSFWTRAEIENWSAYNPEFKELEENEEYDERESEFDDEDEDKIEVKVEDNDGMSDSEIDIITIKPKDYPISSDEEEVDQSSLVYIPIEHQEDFDLIERHQNGDDNKLI